MIVTCTGCRTRFRVADEKVGPRGARLRCTRCATVFTAARPEMAAPGDSPASAGVSPAAASAALAPPTVVSPSAPPPAPAPPPPARVESRLPFDDPFAAAAAGDPFAGAFPPDDPPPADDPFLAAAGVRAIAGEAPADDPFARAGFADDPHGNFAVAETRLQIPAPGIAGPPATQVAFAPSEPPAAGTAASDGDGLALEESSRAASAPPRSPPPPSDAAPPLETWGDVSLDHGPAMPPDAAAAPAPPAAPGPLDFGAIDFGEPPAALPPPPAPTPAPVAVAPRLDAVPASPAAAPAPVTVGEPPAAPERPRARRRLRALGVNALSLAALVVVAAALLGSWRAPRVAPAGPLVARATSSALYDTASHRPVLVVRGEVRSSAAEPLAAQVVVELVDGGRVVSRATATPGAVPTPEEAFAVDGPASAERLAAALAARAPARLAPGETAPFGAVLAELPPDASRLTVRVAATSSP